MRKTALILTCAGLLILSSCRKEAVKIDSGGEVIGGESFTQIMPGQNVKDEVHGKEIGFAYGAIEGVNGSLANGVAYLHQFEDRAFIGSATVNIKVPSDGSVYVAWFTKSDEGAPVKIGTLSNPFGDVRHGVKLDTKSDLTGYDKILITNEREKDVSVPGEAVAGGTLKKMK